MFELIRRLIALVADRFENPAQPAPAAPQSDPAWLAHSARELGIKETPGPRATPRIIQFRAIAGCDLQGDDGAVAWCRIYVCAMFKLAGLPYLHDWMARSVERDPHFVKLAGPALGAVCSFWRSSRASGLGHTGFYRGGTEDGGRILLEGGNQNDGVSRAFYPRSAGSFGLVGYYWPKGLPLPRTGAIFVDDDGAPIASVV
jgi:uncharacterized protein (TIGR02594 family)